ncbi:4-hydroxy-3-methylbut-2-enyl diphosphate reductase [Putridiphycobacter roseus]|uniref:4-hydroxy-3-methylbut-2-enyl diphosphate reductase n=1 Tax=Putridiphycobacter roseus TaxID=2219161 RepID=A0A2W1N1U9_9FLAO|nr:4-hydroxy-3-methylbut-2-enyl diphosphate reductase [Putridiphycobacter roseus]PZE17774.1 4-hydroxy-3-methylbut-2-enyl diphosphate reductase [Putridiphycobacter roseus]
MKTFDIPTYYKSPILGKVKNFRKQEDPRKKDFTPTRLDFGGLEFIIPRHFGFCYGVENAIEISYKAIAENPNKRIYLLSEMIHNAGVNADLQSYGVKFLQDTKGNQIIPWGELTPNDIVIIPAFGTTIAIENQLEDLGISPKKYNTTCPFVEKVWKRSQKLGEDDYTVIIHGKNNHEETRATFSHASAYAKSVVVKNMAETKILAEFIAGIRPLSAFNAEFGHAVSAGFDPEKDFEKIGVVNQTTMLASDTQAITDYLYGIFEVKYGTAIKNHFANTRDTLCYATNDNQSATLELLKESADLAIVIGGYNSSNTSHLVELLAEKFPTYYIQDENELNEVGHLKHFDYIGKKMNTTNVFERDLPKKIIISSGASCPDAVVDRVIQKIINFYPNSSTVEQVLLNFNL